MGGKNPQFIGEVHSLSGRMVIDSAGNVLPPIAGNGRVFYVDSVNGNNGFDGFSARNAKATLANIAGSLAANDIVYLAPGHAETISAAGMVTIAASNVRIYGMGSENERPVFTFNGVVGATFVVTGNNVAVVNVVGLAGIDLLTNPFRITGDDFYGDIEWRDGLATVEALRAVRLDTADRSYLKLKYIGFTTGDATQNAVRIDDCDNVRIDIDAYGRVDATAWVEMVDVASTNVFVKGFFYASGITTLARNVVDTITGSTWYVDGWDGAAGAPFNGGSGNAIAAGDLSVIAANLLVPTADSAANTAMRDVVGNKTDATVADTVEATAMTTQSHVAEVKAILQRIGADNANNTAATTLVADNRDGSVLERTESILATLRDDVASNFIGVDNANNTAATTLVVANEDGSILERLERVQQNTSRGTGTALAANESLADVLYAANGIAVFPAAALPANNVSIAEVLREAYDQSDKAVTNTTATLVNGVTIFTIAGGPIEILSLVARCVTGNDATASTLQWSADGTDGAATTISAASASLANALAGATVVFQGTTLATAPLVNAAGPGLGQQVTNGVVVPAGIITIVIGVGSTTGTWQHHLRYRPLSRGVTVT